MTKKEEIPDRVRNDKIGVRNDKIGVRNDNLKVNSNSETTFANFVFDEKKQTAAAQKPVAENVKSVQNQILNFGEKPTESFFGANIFSNFGAANLFGDFLSKKIVRFHEIWYFLGGISFLILFRFFCRKNEKVFKIHNLRDFRR